MTSFPFACIFDMDGVLIDNREFHKQAWASFLQQYGNKESFDYELLMQQFFGKTNQKIFEFLFDKEISSQELAYWEDVKESMYRHIIDSHIVPLNGLLPFLQIIQQQNIPTGIGTAGPMANVKFVLNKIGAEPFFTAITDSNQIKNGKPDPEVFLLTAQKLGVAPQSCIVFEDSFSGIQAGLNAQMKVVGVATEHSKTVLLQKGCAMAITDFTEISVTDLQTL